MPDPRSVFRLLALAAFILIVALALWLLEAEWPVVVGVMGGAWLLAAAFEWAAWRQKRPHTVISQLPSAPPPEPVPSAPPPPEPVGAPSPPPSEPVPPLLLPPEPEPTAADETPTDPGPPVVEEPPAVPEPPTADEPPKEPEKEAPAPAPPPAPERPPLRPVPTEPRPPLPPSRPATPPPAAARPVRPQPPPGVVDLRTRATSQPRQWNLWDLERLAREGVQQADPDRFDSLSYLFVHLRQFASPDGSLPAEFDGLVRESFGDLLERGR